jgi:hypothetical protein
MKIIVAGSRGFNDYPKLKSVLDELIGDTPKETVEIVSGTANGADKLGEKYADETGLKVVRFPANWDLYGKRAGYLRNVDMAKYGTHCVCFWDRISKGTSHMINIAENEGLELKIVMYE